uniref:Uncharacterized protein n=1 Tax=Peronospora matthiolae TaxID=2874970 RepID=A0AAV1TWG2_9STRA
MTMMTTMLVFSIANACQSEDDDTLTGEDNVLSAVHTKPTAVDKDESTKIILLTLEADLSASFKTLLQMHYTDRKETQTNMEEQMFFHLMKET